MVLGWHGKDKTSSTTNLHYEIEIDDEFPGTAPPLVALQAEFYFCSVKCLRSWLGRLVDKLEDSIQAEGSLDARRIVNPSL